MIYFTSDLHIGHNKPFLYEPRGFSSIEEHDKAIIERWNSIVTPEDKVYILGDLMLNDNDHGIECLKKLKGKKNFIRGNHDTDIRVFLYTDFESPNITYRGESFLFKYKKYHFYLSHYPTLCSNFDDGKYLHQRMINLCGHSHTKNAFTDWDRYNSAIYHCEVDAHDCYPVSIDKIIEEMKEKIQEN